MAQCATLGGVGREVRQRRYAELRAAGATWSECCSELGISLRTCARWERELRGHVGDAQALADREGLAEAAAMVSVLPPVEETAARIMRDREGLAEARCWGVSRLREAMEAALERHRYGDFVRMLTLACDRTGLAPMAAVEPGDSDAPQSPDEVAQLLRDRLAQLEAIESEGDQ